MPPLQPCSVVHCVQCLATVFLSPQNLPRAVVVFCGACVERHAARRCPLKMFGSGDMVLHADSKTDANSLAAYAESFYALEEAVHRETTRIRTASVVVVVAVVVVVVVVVVTLSGTSCFGFGGCVFARYSSVSALARSVLIFRRTRKTASTPLAGLPRVCGARARGRTGLQRPARSRYPAHACCVFDRFGCSFDPRFFRSLACLLLGCRKSTAASTTRGTRPTRPSASLCTRERCTAP